MRGGEASSTFMRGKNRAPAYQGEKESKDKHLEDSRLLGETGGGCVR